MSVITSLLSWTIPAQRLRSYYTAFQTLIGQIETDVFAAREDRNLTLSGGGTLSFTAEGVLAWTAALSIEGHISAYANTVAIGDITVPDGWCVYVALTRKPAAAVAVVATKAAQLPTLNGERLYLLGIRRGTDFWWSNGALSAAGESKTFVELLAAGGGTVLTADELAAVQGAADPAAANVFATMDDLTSGAVGQVDKRGESAFTVAAVAAGGANQTKSETGWFNAGLLCYLKVTGTNGSTRSTIEFFDTDNYAAGTRIARYLDVDLSSPLEDQRPFFIWDTDATSEIHIKVTNNDSTIVETYTFEVVGQGV